MILRFIDRLFTMVHRVLYALIGGTSAADHKKHIGYDYQDDKGKWRRHIYVDRKDQPMP